jgi:flavin-dependent dehydrogenase
MSLVESYDVVVVGGGLAGLQCARLLGKSGIKVLIVDRKVRIGEGVHTTGIFVRRTLEDFDLPEDCLGPPVRRVALYSPARRALTFESAHDEFRVGRMSLLYERYLEGCRQSGVAWSPATRYINCEAKKDRSFIRLETKTQERIVSARYLIGADGAASRVARDLNLDTNKQWIVGVEDVMRGVSMSGAVLPLFLGFRVSPRIHRLGGKRRRGNARRRRRIREAIQPCASSGEISERCRRANV